MPDTERLAESLANDSYRIDHVYRLVIQPKSTHHAFRTSQYGFLFIIRGAVRIRVNTTIYELRPGAVFHAAPGMQMEAKVISGSELEYYSVFYILGDNCAVNGNHACNAHFKLELETTPRIIELLTILHQNAHTPEGVGKLRVKELFLSIMHQVLAGHKNRENNNSPNKEVIEEAISYIKRNYMNLLTLEELAAIHAMNPKRFSYYFYKYAGFRPIDFVIHYRMERACELLKMGNFTVSDIAISVGYANPFYFSRAFKKKFGMPPSAYFRS